MLGYSHRLLPCSFDESGRLGVWQPELNLPQSRCPQPRAIITHACCCRNGCSLFCFAHAGYLARNMLRIKPPSPQTSNPARPTLSTLSQTLDSVPACARMTVWKGKSTLGKIYSPEYDLILDMVLFCTSYVASSLEGVNAHDGGFGWERCGACGFRLSWLYPRELVIENTGHYDPGGPSRQETPTNTSGLKRLAPLLRGR